MDKTVLIDFINQIFWDNKFKKKNITWSLKNSELTKIVNLQKSKFSNTYYLNYGFIINELDLGHLNMHIYLGLSSKSHEENQRIKELLNLEKPIEDKVRLAELKFFVTREIIDTFNGVNSKSDLKRFIVHEKLLNIPEVVQNFYYL